MKDNEKRAYAMLVDMDGKNIMNDEFVGIMQKFPKNAFVQDAGKYTRMGWYVFAFINEADAKACKDELRKFGYTVRITNEPCYLTEEQYNNIQKQGGNK